MSRSVNARISGLYKQSLSERVKSVCAAASLSSEQSQQVRAYLCAGGGLSVEAADSMSENVLATLDATDGPARGETALGVERLERIAARGT